MKEVDKDKIEEAVIKYVDALEIEQLIDYCRSQLNDYYINVASEEEQIEFIKELNIGENGNNR